MPALDGLRGVAVAAVLVFHAGMGWAPGGFLGVSTFFTLSGFLVTLLIVDAHRSGGVDLGTFWTRRARRLVPAALVTFAGVAIFGWLVADASQLATLRGDVLAALASVLNWRFVVEDRSYGDLFASPSPVLHFWSLSIEVQFYVLVPIGLGLALRAFGLRTTAVVVALLASATAVWSAILWTSGHPFDRIYYGTDVRSGELLVGSALALVVARRSPAGSARADRLVDLAGVIGLGLLVALYGIVPLGATWLAQGGFLLVAAVSAVVVLAASRPSGPVVALLTTRPLAGLGRVSYAVYLFHWPLFLWLRQSYGWTSWRLLLVGGGLALALALWSAARLEDPVRAGRRLAGGAGASALALGTAVAVVATFAVTTNPPPDPFADAAAATADTPTAPAPDRPGIDRPLRLLVAGDAPAAALEPGLDRWSGLGDRLGADLAVADATGAACGDDLLPIAHDGPETCAGWVDRWGGALRDTDPDVVLLSLADLDLPTLLAAGGPGAPGQWDGDTDTWVRARLDAALGLLGATGAAVVVVPFPHPLDADDQPEVPREVRRVLASLRDAAMSNPEVTFVEGTGLPMFPRDDPAAVSDWTAEAAAVLAPVVLDAADASAPDLPRVMVTGDSVAWFLGRAFEVRAAAGDERYAWNTAVLGCGIARGGSQVLVWGEVPSSPECDDWAGRWSQQLDAFDPDVVVVHSGLWDLTDRRPAGWDHLGHVGEADFDEWLLDEYGAAVDLLTSTGARVVWLTSPCHGDIGAGALAGNAALDPGRLEHLNTVLLPELVRQRPEVTLVDLDGEVCPDGALTQQLFGFDDARPDGVHFSTEASDALAGWLEPQLPVRADR